MQTATSLWRTARSLMVALLLIGAANVHAIAVDQAKVISVVDGDTMNIERGTGKERVILFGVDCPELGQPGGEEARKFTDDKCWKKTVGVEEVGKDRSGRVIAVIHLADGKSLNEQLVGKGLAWWSDKYAPNDEKLKGLQASAQMSKLGVWAAPNPVAPWIWRNGQKGTSAKILPASH